MATITTIRSRRYTPECVEAILLALAAGAPRVYAAAAGGISHDTLDRWTAKYEDFRVRVQEADTAAVTARLKRIQSAGERGIWQADAWLLERRWPEYFGRREAPGVTIQAVGTFTLAIDRPGQHAPLLEEER